MTSGNEVQGRGSKDGEISAGFIFIRITVFILKQLILAIAHILQSEPNIKPSNDKYIPTEAFGRSVLYNHDYLSITAFYGPKQLSDVIEHARYNREVRVRLAEDLILTNQVGWTGLQLIIFMAKKQLVDLSKFANFCEVVASRLYLALNKKNNLGETGWNMLGKYAPEQLAPIVELFLFSPYIKNILKMKKILKVKKPFPVRVVAEAFNNGEFNIKIEPTSEKINNNLDKSKIIVSTCKKQAVSTRVHCGIFLQTNIEEKKLPQPPMLRV